jgi:hypothetical protein
LRWQTFGVRGHVRALHTGRKELAAAAVPGFNAAMPQVIRTNLFWAEHLLGLNEQYG